MRRLDGKVALVSGGARGQGAAEAKMFASEGASVVIGDVLDEEGKKVEAEIAEAGGEATFVHLDVRSDADWVNAIETRRQGLWQAKHPGEQRWHSTPKRCGGDQRRGMGYGHGD